MLKGYLKVALTLTLGFLPLQALPTFASEDLFPNGLFLYGQSLQPNEIGQEYLVFEVQQNQVKGAVYLPYSEFSCFEGTVTSQGMNLSITDPYSETAYPVTISLQQEAIAASVAVPSTMVGLEGYHQLNGISDRDQQILNTCLAE